MVKEYIPKHDAEYKKPVPKADIRHTKNKTVNTFIGSNQLPLKKPTTTK